MWVRYIPVRSLTRVDLPGAVLADECDDRPGWQVQADVADGWGVGVGIPEGQVLQSYPALESGQAGSWFRYRMSRDLLVVVAQPEKLAGDASDAGEAGDGPLDGLSGGLQAADEHDGQDQRAEGHRPVERVADHPGKDCGGGEEEERGARTFECVRSDGQAHAGLSPAGHRVREVGPHGPADSEHAQLRAGCG